MPLASLVLSSNSIFKTSSVPSLPTELWFHIIGFIPLEDLYKLAGVNRAFFEEVMNEVYSQLSFISADPRIFYEKLATLQNPTLSERIRVLTVWPSAVRDAINAIEHDKSRPPGQPDVPERSRTPQPRFKHVRYLSRGREYVEELLGHHKPPQPAPTAPNGKEPLPSPEERTKLFKESLRRLSRVEEFELNWYIDQGKDHHAWSFSLFPDIWQGIGQHLRRLAIDIQVAKMGDAVTSCLSLPRLEVLDLTLRCYPSRSDLYSEQYQGDTIVPYFINKFAPTLQELSMKTIGHQELSQHFQLLGVFPRLTKLTIVMPLDSYHLRDPSGYRRMLKNHPQIRDLSIKYTRCCRDCTEDGFDTFEGKHKLYGDVHLPALRSLELGLHIPIPKGIMNNSLYHNVVRQLGTTNNTLYYCLAQMGSELTSLTLTDRNLTLEEVKTLLGLFPSYRLKRLSFFAKVLSPRLIDAIAQACPSLSSLSLDVETVSSQDPCTETYMNPDVEGFAKALYSYGVDRQYDRWRYRAWTLADVSVMRWELKVGHQYNWRCMQAIAAVVPSVRSFAGRGHMEPDSDLKTGGGQRLVELDARTKPLDT
ncbi:hypothetical protein CVT26_008999 [Gymnopilus dilepis]|uniref:F-box domain-containing protein n=1 Tax=Gymnopilus dilepis TaxID=231916 RepID=A0A409YR82_9AGAR|nr:hypothetical protein CVT26_008999 [Gymnopilus dilepis]